MKNSCLQTCLEEFYLKHYFNNFAAKGVTCVESLCVIPQSEYASYGITNKLDSRRLYQLIKIIRDLRRENKHCSEKCRGPTTYSGVFYPECELEEAYTQLSGTGSSLESLSNNRKDSRSRTSSGASSNQTCSSHHCRSDGGNGGRHNGPTRSSREFVGYNFQQTLPPKYIQRGKAEANRSRNYSEAYNDKVSSFIASSKYSETNGSCRAQERQHGPTELSSDSNSRFYVKLSPPFSADEDVSNLIRGATSVKFKMSPNTAEGLEHPPSESDHDEFSFSADGVFSMESSTSQFVKTTFSQIFTRQQKCRLAFVTAGLSGPASLRLPSDALNLVSSNSATVIKEPQRLFYASQPLLSMSNSTTVRCPAGAIGVDEKVPPSCSAGVPATRTPPATGVPSSSAGSSHTSYIDYWQAVVTYIFEYFSTAASVAESSSPSPPPPSVSGVQKPRSGHVVIHAKLFAVTTSDTCHDLLASDPAAATTNKSESVRPLHLVKDLISRLQTTAIEDPAEFHLLMRSQLIQRWAGGSKQCHSHYVSKKNSEETFSAAASATSVAVVTSSTTAAVPNSIAIVLLLNVNHRFSGDKLAAIRLIHFPIIERLSPYVLTSSSSSVAAVTTPRLSRPAPPSSHQHHHQQLQQHQQLQHLQQQERSIHMKARKDSKDYSSLAASDQDFTYSTFFNPLADFLQYVEQLEIDSSSNSTIGRSKGAAAAGNNCSGGSSGGGISYTYHTGYDILWRLLFISSHQHILLADLAMTPPSLPPPPPSLTSFHHNNSLQSSLVAQLLFRLKNSLWRQKWSSESDGAATLGPHRPTAVIQQQQQQQQYTNGDGRPSTLLRQPFEIVVRKPHRLYTASSKSSKSSRTTTVTGRGRSQFDVAGQYVESEADRGGSGTSSLSSSISSRPGDFRGGLGGHYPPNRGGGLRQRRRNSSGETHPEHISSYSSSRPQISTRASHGSHEMTRSTSPSSLNLLSPSPPPSPQPQSLTSSSSQLTSDQNLPSKSKSVRHIGVQSSPCSVSSCDGQPYTFANNAYGRTRKHKSGDHSTKKPLVHTPTKDQTSTPKKYQEYAKNSMEYALHSHSSISRNLDFGLNGSSGSNNISVGGGDPVASGGGGGGGVGGTELNNPSSNFNGASLLPNLIPRRHPPAPTPSSTAPPPSRSRSFHRSNSKDSDSSCGTGSNRTVAARHTSGAWQRSSDANSQSASHPRHSVDGISNIRKALYESTTPTNNSEETIELFKFDENVESQLEKFYESNSKSFAEKYGRKSIGNISLRDSTTLASSGAPGERPPSANAWLNCQHKNKSRDVHTADTFYSYVKSPPVVRDLDTPAIDVKKNVRVVKEFDDAPHEIVPPTQLSSHHHPAASADRVRSDSGNSNADSGFSTNGGGRPGDEVDLLKDFTIATTAANGKRDQFASDSYLQQVFDDASVPPEDDRALHTPTDMTLVRGNDVKDIGKHDAQTDIMTTTVDVQPSPKIQPDEIFSRVGTTDEITEPNADSTGLVDHKQTTATTYHGDIYPPAVDGLLSLDKRVNERGAPLLYDNNFNSINLDFDAGHLSVIHGLEDGGEFDSSSRHHDAHDGSLPLKDALSLHDERRLEGDILMRSADSCYPSSSAAGRHLVGLLTSSLDESHTTLKRSRPISSTAAADSLTICDKTTSGNMDASRTRTGHRSTRIESTNTNEPCRPTDSSLLSLTTKSTSNIYSTTNSISSTLANNLLNGSQNVSAAAVAVVPNTDSNLLTTAVANRIDISEKDLKLPATATNSISNDCNLPHIPHLHTPHASELIAAVSHEPAGLGPSTGATPNTTDLRPCCDRSTIVNDEKQYSHPLHLSPNLVTNKPSRQFSSSPDVSNSNNIPHKPIEVLSGGCETSTQPPNPLIPTSGTVTSRRDAWLAHHEEYTFNMVKLCKEQMLLLMDAREHSSQPRDLMAYQERIDELMSKQKLQLSTFQSRFGAAAAAGDERCAGAAAAANSNGVTDTNSKAGDVAATATNDDPVSR